MSTELTRNLLKIFWQGDEVSGLTAYAYGVPGLLVQPAFPLELWPIRTESICSQLTGQDWLVWLWDVKTEIWPTPWIKTIQLTLSRFVELGSPVAWCGLDGCFTDPPDLLSPTTMGGGIYAAFSEATGFVCHTDIDSPFQPISDMEMLKLREQILKVAKL